MSQHCPNAKKITKTVYDPSKKKNVNKTAYQCDIVCAICRGIGQVDDCADCDGCGLKAGGVRCSTCQCYGKVPASTVAA